MIDRTGSRKIACVVRLTHHRGTMAAKSQITRGFQRLAIVLSAPFFVAAVVLAFFQWQTPTGPVKEQIPGGALAFQFDENTIDSTVRELLNAQLGFGLPRNMMLVGLPIGATTQDGKEWTKFKLADGREIGIASTDRNKLETIARTFLLNEKRTRHQYRDTDTIEIEGVPVKFLNFSDQYPPASSPWLVKSYDWSLVLGSLFAAVAICIMIWAIGWVIRGFSRPT